LLLIIFLDWNTPFLFLFRTTTNGIVGHLSRCHCYLLISIFTQILLFTILSYFLLVHNLHFNFLVDLWHCVSWRYHCIRWIACSVCLLMQVILNLHELFQLWVLIVCNISTLLSWPSTVHCILPIFWTTLLWIWAISSVFNVRWLQCIWHTAFTI
jgi:hypothetical protein